MKTIRAKAALLLAVAPVFLGSWVMAQDIPAPPRALLEAQTRQSQWEREQESLRREAEMIRMRMQLMRAQQELRDMGGASSLPGVVAIFSHEGGRSALLGEPGGAQWVVREGETIPSGHRVERIQPRGVVVATGEGRRVTRTTLRPLPASAPGADAAPGPAGATPGAVIMPPMMPPGQMGVPPMMPPGQMGVPPMMPPGQMGVPPMMPPMMPPGQMGVPSLGAGLPR